eukprot:2756669-Prymnesium_polylepis.1
MNEDTDGETVGWCICLTWCIFSILEQGHFGFSDKFTNSAPTGRDEQLRHHERAAGARGEGEVKQMDSIECQPTSRV